MNLPETQRQIVLAKRPVGLPDPDTFAASAGPIPDIGEGQILVEVELISLDPAMRSWLDDRPSYIPPVQIGEVMRAIGIGRVVASNVDRFAPGDRVSGMMGWQEYAVFDAKGLQPVPPGASSELALGPLGMTGMTAYFGLLDIGDPKPGETVLVSGAAGAVGSLVGQIAKIKGCRVVGTAGTDEKCRWLTEELGFDAAVNYKTAERLSTAIKAACPDGVDVYFDNVGGPLLDVALTRLNRKARVVICGAISLYNATSRPKGPSNYMALLVKRARMEGFVVFDYVRQYGEAVAAMNGWIEEGRIQVRYDVVDGLENASSALLTLFSGANTGKLMVRVSSSGKRP